MSDGVSVLLGAVHKRCLHKIAKNWLPVRKLRTGLTSLISCPCGHTINFKKSEVFAPKTVDDLIWSLSLSEKCPYWMKPHFPPDYGRLLWTERKKNQVVYWLKEKLSNWELSYRLDINLASGKVISLPNSPILHKVKFFWHFVEKF